MKWLKVRFSRLSTANQVAVKNVNWLLLEKVIGLPISLVVSIVMARYLGTSGFGEFNYLVSLVGLVAPIGVLGLSGIITRELIAGKQLPSVVLGTSLVGRLLGSLLAMVALLTMALFMSVENTDLLVYLAVCQMMTSIHVFSFWFQAKHLNKYDVVSRLSVLVIASIIKLIVLWQGAGVETIVYIAGLEYFAQGLMLLYLHRHKGGEPRLSVNLGYLSSLVKQSSFLLLSGVAAGVYLKIDQVMIGNLVGTDAVGLYAVASRLSEVWYFLPGAIATAFFPNLLTLKTSDESGYLRKLQQLSDLLFWSAFAIAIGTNLVAWFFVPLIFGEGFTGAVPILAIHVFAGLFIFVRALVSKWIIAEGLLRFSLVTHLSGAVVNVVLNAWLIPAYGGIGAAWSTLFSYAAASYLALFFSAHTRGMAMVITKSFVAPIRIAFSR